MFKLEKLYKLDELNKLLLNLRIGKKIIFTNGCFDIVHAGHVDYLTKAKNHGDILVVGVNSDNSISSIKGPQRPIVKLDYRLRVLNALSMIDYLLVFEENTPIHLIKKIKPDILIKGADWKNKKLVGQEFVESNGGKVDFIDLVPSISTTEIINKILDTHK